MKLTLRLLGIFGILSALAMFPLRYGIPVMAESRRALSEEEKTGGVAPAANAKLYAAISADAARSEKMIAQADGNTRIAVVVLGLLSLAVFGASFFSKGRVPNNGIKRPNKSVQTTAMTPPPSATRGAPLSDL